MSAALRPDYGAWPTIREVLARLESAGIALRDAGRIPGVLDEVIQEVGRRTLRQFVPDVSDTIRTYDGTGTAEMEVDEMIALTSVVAVGYWGLPEYALTHAGLVREWARPMTRLVVGQGSSGAFAIEGAYAPYPALFPAGRQNIRVAGRFGYGDTIPESIWSAVAGEAAYRLAQEALFAPEGRVKLRMEGDVRNALALAEAEGTGWHARFQQALRDYRRPPGRRLRGMRPRMI